MPNPVVHFEITGPDGSALQKFYAETFGWTINADNPMSYGLTDTGGSGINGGIGTSEKALAKFFIEVHDPAAYLERVVNAGAELVQDVTGIPGMLTFAQFRDPAETSLAWSRLTKKTETVPGPFKGSARAGAALAGHR